MKCLKISNHSDVMIPSRKLLKMILFGFGDTNRTGLSIFEAVVVPDSRSGVLSSGDRYSGFGRRLFVWYGRCYCKCSQTDVGLR